MNELTKWVLRAAGAAPWLLAAASLVALGMAAMAHTRAGPALAAAGELGAEAPTTSVAQAGPSDARTPLAASTESLLSAVASGPFRATRDRPPDRYRASDMRDSPESADRAADPMSGPALVGVTAIGHGRGTAALRFADGRTRVLRTGDDFNGFTLLEVSSVGAIVEVDGREWPLQIRPEVPE